MTTEKTDSVDIRNNHSRCMLCGHSNPWSLKLSFCSGDNEAVWTRFTANPRLQGYDGIMHGGVIAALLDAAMTHCLFHRGLQAITGDLHVRFVHSIPCDAEMEIRARIISHRHAVYRLRAEIECNGTIMSWAEAAFMKRRLSSDLEVKKEQEA